jgi:uncharacterized membrane protein HdeD (DUF308 family)
VLLLGPAALRERWPLLLGVGLIGIGLAAAIVIDTADGVTVVATETFGWIFIIDGLSALAMVAAHETRSGSHRLDLARALGLIVLGLLILDVPWQNDIANSVLFGVAFLIDGAARILTALVVRFQGWALVVAGGVVELGLAMLAFASWPVPYHTTVPFCVGVLLLLSGWTVLRLAFMVRKLPAGGSILALPTFSRQCWYTHMKDGTPSLPARDTPLPPRTESPPLVLHVWTPLRSAADPVRWPLIDRWIAALDKKGQISTGHAALELAPDVYISHYPRTEVERSTADFVRQLRATADNDVPGRFLSSYRYEVETWFEADAHVAFLHFDAARLRANWAAYSKDDTYNLTRRNCSVAVAVAIEAALEGTFDERPFWRRLLRLAASRDLWVAAAVRRRAEAMTWTPGLVLDYARALHRVVDASCGRSVTGQLRAAAAEGCRSTPPTCPGRDAGSRV